MSRGKSFTGYAESISLLCFLQIVTVVTVLLTVLILHYHPPHQTYDAITNTINQTYCPPSSCGKITNISHPFRLKNDPTSCGDPKYELSCENNITVLTLFSGKYYVKSINYEDYTIQVVDPGIQKGNCSSLPRYFLTKSNFTTINNEDPYQIMDNWYMYGLPYGYIIYLKCSKQVNDDPEYVDTTPCISSDSKSYLYAVAADFHVDYEHEDYESHESYYRKHHFLVGRLKDYCQVKLVAMSSSYFPSVREGVSDRHRPLSYEEIHGMLLYGFQLSWMSGACKDSCGDTQKCYFNHTIGNVECYHPNDDYCTYPLEPDASKPCDQVPKQFILMEDIILGIVKGKTNVVNHIRRFNREEKLILV